jgi:integrase
MPRVSPDYVPKLRQHAPSGRAIVTLNGKDFYLGAYGSAESQARYHELIAKWISNGRQPLDRREIVTASPTMSPATMTISTLVDAYQRHAEQYHGAEHSETYAIKRLVKMLVKHFGGTLANDFGPSKLRLIREQLDDGKRTRHGVNRDAHRIKRIFKWAASEELVAVAVHQTLQTLAPLKRGKCKAPESKAVKPVPAAWVAAIKPHVTTTIWDIVQLQRLCGCRGGELLKLRPIDIDTTGDIWIAELTDHKTAGHGHIRRLYFGPKAQAILTPRLANKAVDAYLFSPRESNAEAKQRGAKIMRRIGQKPNKKKTARVMRDTYDHNSYRKAIQRGCEKAGCPVWHPHQLRHSAATEWRKQYGPDQALVMLGDKTNRMSDIYMERDEQVALKIAGEVG